jgi:hypothetical protein
MSFDLSRRLAAEALGTFFVSVSGAHFNPAVSLVMWLRGDLDRAAGLPLRHHCAAYVLSRWFNEPKSTVLQR